MGKKTVKKVENKKRVEIEDSEEGEENEDSEKNDDSEDDKGTEKKNEKSKKLKFEDSDNEYFRTHSRNKTPFFIVSEPDERKEGLDLIREISEELDNISKQLLPIANPNPPNPIPSNYTLSIPLNIKSLPKPTRRDIEKDNEKLLTYKTLPLSTSSNNKTFSFT